MNLEIIIVYKVNEDIGRRDDSPRPGATSFMN